MSGLLEKDYRLLMQRKKYLAMYVLLAVILSFTVDGTFIVSYITMLGALLSVSTISYDEFDNGYPFLMTLPVDAKLYAVEKYVFTGLTMGITWLAAVIIQTLCSLFTGAPFDLFEMLPVYASYLPVFLVMTSLLIPIDLKFGAEKGRIAMFLLFGILFVAILAGGKLLSYLGVDLGKTLSFIDRLPAPVLPVLLVMGALGIIGISLACSIHIMAKKEF